ADVDGVGRNTSGVGRGAEGKGEVDELARPQASIGVLELRLKLDGSSRTGNGVVYKAEPACLRAPFVRREPRIDLKSARSHVTSYIRQILLRDRKSHVNGHDLIDNH